MQGRQSDESIFLYTHGINFIVFRCSIYIRASKSKAGEYKMRIFVFVGRRKILCFLQKKFSLDACINISMKKESKLCPKI
jgi:hypothetical protein